MRRIIIVPVAVAGVLLAGGLAMLGAPGAQPVQQPVHKELTIPQPAAPSGVVLPPAAGAPPVVLPPPPAAVVAPPAVAPAPVAAPAAH